MKTKQANDRQRPAAFWSVPAVRLKPVRVVTAEASDWPELYRDGRAAPISRRWQPSRDSSCGRSGARS